MASAANVLRWVDLRGEGDRSVCVCERDGERERLSKRGKERERGGMGEGPQSARSAQVELH